MMKTYKETLYKKSQKDPNMHPIEGAELKHLQQVMLEILLDVKTVCDNHVLNYVLLGGSALGAVRHNGYIPWDDDVDIGMPRKDYEVFKNIFIKELGDKYVLNAPNYEEKSRNRFPVVMKKGTKFIEYLRTDDGFSLIKIDIFILENIPNLGAFRLIKGLYCTFLMFAGGYTQSYEAYKLSLEKKSYRSIIGGIFAFFHSSDKWFNIFDRACRCNNEKSKLIGIPSGRKHYFGEILPRQCFLPPTTGIFEGFKLSIPADVDCYLKNLYGDYMQIPPEDKREKHYVSILKF